jgi:hypothetical protein
MSVRLLTLSLVILLLAMGAFVIDVLSPYTPTPTASAIKVVFVVFLCVLRATLFVSWSRYLGVGLPVARPRAGLRLAQRTLVVRLCSLLC